MNRISPGRTPEKMTNNGQPTLTVQQYNDRELDLEEKNSRLKNIGLLIRGMFCGVIECFTCCCCCCGCCGKVRNHSGMVKYDDPDFMAMSTDNKKVVVIEEHGRAAILCSPYACISCWCCLGGCGICGPRMVSTTIQCATQKK